MEREPGADWPNSALGLFFEDGLRKGERVDVGASGLIVGRSLDANVSLGEDVTVSKQHARIARTPSGQMYVEDLGSRNGTYVNDMKIVGRHDLRAQDTIRIGSTTFRVGNGDRAQDDMTVTQLIPPTQESSSQGKEPRPDAATLLEEAKRLYGAGRLTESEEAFRGVLESPQHAAEGHYGLGLVRLGAGSLTEAEKEFLRSLALDPRYANSAFQLGVIAERRGSSDEAVARYHQVIEANPTHAGALKALERLGPPANTEPDLPSTPDEILEYGVYDFLKTDKSPLSRQALDVMDALNRSGRPNLSAFLGSLLTKGLIFIAIATAVASLLRIETVPLPDDRTLVLDIPAWIPPVIVVAAIVPILYSVILVATMRIRINRGRLQLEKGIFRRNLTNLELWRVKDIELKQGFWNRLTKDGTLIMTAYQETEPVEVTGIARGPELREIYQQILNLSFLLRSSPVVKGIVM
jgi:tetratricopeptide (TPR) repeat protein